MTHKFMNYNQLSKFSQIYELHDSYVWNTSSTNDSNLYFNHQLEK